MASSATKAFTIHQATREDVPTILQLIIDLATYEREASSVEATPEKLLNTLSFAPSPLSPPTGEPSVSSTRPARCLMLIPSSTTSSSSPPPTAVGIALYYTTYSTWRAHPGLYLEDLYISPSHRGLGGGKALLQALASEVVATGGGRLEWSVLRWNEPSIRFYESQAIGAKPMNDWLGMRVDGEALTKLAEGGARVD